MEERAAKAAAKAATAAAERAAKDAEKAAAKAAKDAEKAAAKAEKEAAAAAAKAAKEAERAAAKAAKAAAEPKRRVGRPNKTSDGSSSVVSSVSAGDGEPLRPAEAQLDAEETTEDGRITALEAEVAELRARLAAEVTAKQALLARISAVAPLLAAASAALTA